MVIPIISNPDSEWLIPGSSINPRLLHSAPDDKILLYPAEQGYRQEIMLEDGLSLKIVDYTLHQDTLFQSRISKPYVKLELELAIFGVKDGRLTYGSNAQSFGLIPGRQRVFELEIVLKQPLISKYFQRFSGQLPSRPQSALRQILEGYSIYSRRSQKRRLTNVELLNCLFKRQETIQLDQSPTPTLTPALLGKALDFGLTLQPRLTPAMKQGATQILSCPYQGVTRRNYLKDKTLALISEYSETLCQPPHPPEEIDRIYDAAAILRAQLTNPPGVEELARRVYTNRFKLYQGFHAIYGTTPVGYLRYHRIAVALWLFHTSDLSVSQVAAAVGYTNRGRFASAFYRQVGMNPKTFQLQLQRKAV